MAHNRKLVLGCVALTMARVKPAKAVATAGNRVRDELENEIITSGYMDGAPFKWIGLIIREGLKDESVPHYGKIDPKDGELPLAIEINVHRLLGSSEDEIERVFRETTLKALVHAGEKYHRPVEKVKALLQSC